MWVVTRNTVCVIALVVVSVQASYNATFSWHAHKWTDCLFRNEGSTCCDCYRTREISCVFKDTHIKVSPFYCRKLGTAQPQMEEPCEPCVQDCVLSTWSEWSACSDICAPSTRYRTRRVLVTASSGGQDCGVLLDREECPDPMPRCSAIPEYRWDLGDWTGCRLVGLQLFIFRNNFAM